MIFYKTEEEIEFLKKSNRLVSATLAELAKVIEPGITTLQLDKLAEEFIRDNGAEPGFLGYHGFPNTLCTSVNGQVVHGIPNKKALDNGDIVSVDCGTFLNGFFGDSAYTFKVGEVDADVDKLLTTTKESLYKGLQNAVVGKRLGDIGHAIQSYVQERGYSVVREMVGHGIGRNLHEDPQVPNYGRAGRGIKLQTGLVIAVEPMINMGKKEIVQEADGWTVRTIDNMPSAHFEHSVVVRKGQAELLSTFEPIEEVLNKK